MQRWGVPASVTLAQWILESAWGQSQLARRYSNFFGIKAQPGQAYAEFTTREVVAGRAVSELAHFARYASPAEGIAEHARFLATLDRYQPAMRERHDVNAFCEQLQHCGYSTSPAYARSLLSLIREFDLTRYDTPAAPAIALSAA